MKIIIRNQNRGSNHIKTTPTIWGVTLTDVDTEPPQAVHRPRSRPKPYTSREVETRSKKKAR